MLLSSSLGSMLTTQISDSWPIPSNVSTSLVVTSSIHTTLGAVPSLLTAIDSYSIIATSHAQAVECVPNLCVLSLTLPTTSSTAAMGTTTSCSSLPGVTGTGCSVDTRTVADALISVAEDAASLVKSRSDSFGPANDDSRPQVSHYGPGLSSQSEDVKNSKIGNCTLPPISCDKSLIVQLH